MAEIEINGRCLCGFVTYRVAKEPNWCGHCHCSDCRRYSGSAVATFAGFDKEYFALTGGEFGSFE